MKIIEAGLFFIFGFLLLIISSLIYCVYRKKESSTAEKNDEQINISFNLLKNETKEQLMSLNPFETLWETSDNIRK